MKKPDLALNNQRWLICDKTKPKRYQFRMYELYLALSIFSLGNQSAPRYALGMYEVSIKQ